MFKNKPKLTEEDNDLLEDIDSILNKNENKIEKKQEPKIEELPQNFLNIDENPKNTTQKKSIQTPLSRPDLSNLGFDSNMPSPILKTEEKEEYVDDFDHLSEIKPEKSQIKPYSLDKRPTESLLLKELALDSNTNEETREKPRKFHKKITKKKSEVNREDFFHKEIQKLQAFLSNFSENSETSLLPQEDIISENKKIHKILKKFSNLLTTYMESTPQPISKPLKPKLSLEAINKFHKNNVNLLKNLNTEYFNIYKMNENLRNIDEIEFDIKETEQRIKEISQDIYQIKLKKEQNSKELNILENLGFPAKKREFQRVEREFLTFESKNRFLREKNQKIEEKLDKYLGKYDVIKEKYKKHMVVAQKMNVVLDKELMKHYESIQERIQTEANNFLILNKRDEFNYKHMEKKKQELIADSLSFDENIHGIDKKLKEQEEFLKELDENNFEITENFAIKYAEILKELRNIGVCSEKKREKSMFLGEIREILRKEIDPTRLFMERPFRKYERKNKRVEKALKKPISLMDLNRNNNIRSMIKGNDNSMNSQYISIDKQKTRNYKGKHSVSNENPIYTVPFRIKKEKKEIIHLEAKKQDFNEFLNKSRNIPDFREKNEENGLFITKPMEIIANDKNIEKSNGYEPWKHEKPDILNLKENIKENTESRVWTQEKEELAIIDNQNIIEKTNKINEKQGLNLDVLLTNTDNKPVVKSFNFNKKKIEKQESPEKTNEKPINSQENHVNYSGKPFLNQEKRVITQEKPVFSNEKTVYLNEQFVVSQKKGLVSEEKHVVSNENTFLVNEKSFASNDKSLNIISKPVISQQKPQEKPVISNEKPIELQEKPIIPQKVNDNVPKTFNLNQKKVEIFKKSNIFQETPGNIFDIPEIKASNNDDKRGSNAQKVFKTDEIINLDSSKDLFPNKKEEIIKENKETEQKSPNIQLKMNNLRMKQEDNKDKQNTGGMIDNEGKNTFFDGFELI